MFTVCSKCNLRLTVTALDLRAAQGYVRCGRCHNVFNALAALADDPTREAQAEGTAAATQSRPALTLPAPRAPEPAVPEPAEDLTSTDASLEFNPASTNINEVFIEPSSGEGTGTFESVILVGDDPADAAPGDAGPVIAPQALSAPAVPAPADHGGPVDVPSRRDALAEPLPAAALVQAAAADTPDPADVAVAAPADDEDEIVFTSTWSAAPSPPARDAFAVDAAAVREIATAMHGPEPGASADQPEDLAPDAVLLGTDRAIPRVPAWAQRAVVRVLLLCLVAQALHHYRGQLADTALLHRPLTALYQALGQPLDPHWDVTRYEIRQLGATTDGAPAGDLVVRASISNRATRDQPLPLLRVVMQDRFGNRVAARDLKPAEYLGRGAPQVSLMAPGQRVDVQVAFQDPGRAATGFEIDACMAGHAGAVTCANDPGSH